jgi:hypothetical protein
MSMNAGLVEGFMLLRNPMIAMTARMRRTMRRTKSH